MKVISRYGDFVTPDYEDLIIKSFFMYGEWAQLEINLLLKFIQKNFYVIDAGAFLGSHSRAFSEACPSGRIFAFEPNPKIYEYLEVNAELSKEKNIQTFNFALGDLNESLFLSLSDKTNKGASCITSSNLEDSILIDVKRLDDCGIQKIDFIKADVEGFEYNLILGAQEIIKQNSPRIFLELNSINDSSKIMDWANSNNYLKFGVVSAAYNRENINAERENIYGEAKECGILLLHREDVEGIKIAAELNLPALDSLDSIALILLNKPQYPHEVLAKTKVAESFTIEDAWAAGNRNNYYSNFLLGAIQNELKTSNEIDLDRLNNQKHLIKDHGDKLKSIISNLEIEKKLIEGRLKSLPLISDFNQVLDTSLLKQTALINQHGELLEKILSNSLKNDNEVIQLKLSIDNSSDKLFDYLEKQEKLIEEKNSLSDKLNNLEHLLSNSEKSIIQSNKTISMLENEKNIIEEKQYYLAIKKFNESRQRTELSIKSRINYLKIVGAAMKPFYKTVRAENEISGDNVNNITICAIMPIYRDTRQTYAAIISAIPDILIDKSARFIAINDCSPEHDMADMLNEFSTLHPSQFQVVTNTENLGFIRSVNKGFALAEKSDVVLLNSDIELGQNWLKRLQSAAYSAENIGTVTPLSNNATICSFPKFLGEFDLPIGWSLEEIDSTFAKRTMPPVDVPTGVGFCMYIKNACLNVVGNLNYEIFGKGYGEENDFCQRAIKLGWRNTITSDLFVYHKGSVSFTDEKASLVENAMKAIDQLHPNYHKDVQIFIKNDPLKEHRIQRAIDLLRLSHRPVCLAISHEMGGGVKQHIGELAKYLSQEMHTIVLQPRNGSQQVILSLFPLEEGDEILFDCEHEYESLIEVLKDIRLSFVHFHHTHGLNPKIWSIPTDLSIKYAMTAHDFYWINANPTLTNDNGIHIPGQIENLNNPLYPLPRDITEQQWRDALAPLVENAEFLLFPSNSTLEIFSGFYKNEKRFAVYHPDVGRESNKDFSQHIPKDNIKLLALGALGREKGADLLDSVSGILKNHSCNTTLLGYAYRPLINVTATGPYNADKTEQLIQDHKPDVFLFTALWPETFSYTLSYAIAYGAPIIAPNVGAFPERLSGYKNALLYNHLETPEEISEKILAFLNYLKDGKTFFTESLKTAMPPEAFYKNTYIKTILSIERTQVHLREKNTVNLNNNHTHSSKNTKKEWILVFLWKIYQSRVGYWIARLIPFRIKRSIKRHLSKKSIADITNS